MEKGTLIGLIVCVVGVFGSAVLHGINIAFLFMEIGSILIVFAGCIGATMISFPMEATSNVTKYFQKVMKGNKDEASAMGTITWLISSTTKLFTARLFAVSCLVYFLLRPAHPRWNAGKKPCAGLTRKLRRNGPANISPCHWKNMSRFLNRKN